MHGTESSAPYRGGQAWEIYNNSFVGNAVPGGQEVFTARSGSAVIWGNTFSSDNDYPRIVHAYDYRTITTYGIWGGVTGVNGFDDNVPGTFATGNATDGSSLTLIDSTQNWTANQFKEAGFAYILRNLNPTGTEKAHSIITGNTATTITFRAAQGGKVSISFDLGDAYEVRKVNTTLDQVGYNGGDLINRTTPVWPNQVLTPIYIWNNTYLDGTVIDLDTHTSIGPYVHIVKGTHMVLTARPGYTPYP